MALQLLDELRQAPISYRPQLRPRDARGRSEYRWGRGFLIDWLETLIETCFYMLTVRCFPVMPAELAWLFATRPVFMYPELLPCASLDPALYCPRRTAAFTPAEDWWAHTHCNTKRPEKNLHHALSVRVCVCFSLLVLGLRNMEGSCDPPKLVSQFLLRKSLVQVRRRILQCCRPGFPDNVVKVTQTYIHIHGASQFMGCILPSTWPFESENYVCFLIRFFWFVKYLRLRPQDCKYNIVGLNFCTQQ